MHTSTPAVVDPIAIGVAVSSLPADDELVVAVRIGLEVRDRRLALREAGLDVHGGDGEYWRRLATNHVPQDELQRRRAIPGQNLEGGVA